MDEDARNAWRREGLEEASRRIIYISCAVTAAAFALMLACCLIYGLQFLVPVILSAFGMTACLLSLGLYKAGLGSVAHVPPAAVACLLFPIGALFGYPAACLAGLPVIAFLLALFCSGRLRILSFTAYICLYTAAGLYGGCGVGQAAASVAASGVVYAAAHALSARDRELCTRIGYLEEALRELNEQNCTDALTGFGNVRFYEMNIRQAVSAHDILGTPVSLIMLDIDFFKRINDVYGHDNGNLALQSFAGTAAKVVGESGICCRVGGEEFAVITRHGIEETAELAEKIRAAVEAMDIRATGSFTVSCGVAGLREGMDPKQLYEQADRMLYTAKNTGRNRVCADRTSVPEEGAYE